VLRNWKHQGEETQETRPKGRQKDGRPYEPIEIPLISKEEVLAALEKVSKRVTPDED
jgi:hypothetical protein